MDGINILGSGESITQRLDKIDSIIRSGKLDFILAVYQVVISIQEKVSSIQGIPAKIIERIGDTITILDSLIPEGEHTFEPEVLGISSSLGEIDIFLWEML